MVQEAGGTDSLTRPESDGVLHEQIREAIFLRLCYNVKKSNRPEQMLMLNKNKEAQPYEDIDFQHYYRGKPLNIVLLVLKNIGIVLGILAAATFISFGFRAMGFHESNYIMTFILGVLLVAYFTDGHLYGVLASILGVMVFNFFFTRPYYTFAAYSPEYPVTFVIMLVVALITGTLTVQVKRESRRAEIRERRIHILYQMEKNLLAVKNEQQILEVVAKDINGLFGSSVLVGAADLNGELHMRHTLGPSVFDDEREQRACMEAFESGMECGAGTELFSDCRAYYFPITGQNGVLGVIGIAFTGSSQLLESRRVFLETVGAQVSLAMERERLYVKQQQVKMEIEREHLRGNLLRAVSHDLRTPLTGILGSASTVIDHYDRLSDAVKKDFLSKIYEDTIWLSNLVENILSITRFDEGKVKLKTEMEAVEEIVAAAVSRIKKHAGGHEIKVSIPQELIMICADGILIEQVLVNLLDNAIKHTHPDAKIAVSARRTGQMVAFEVSDTGPGIPENDLPFVFDRFYTAGDTRSQARRGSGLGLSICESIVKAHGGQISVRNSPSGGAVFEFTLPIKGDAL